MLGHMVTQLIVMVGQVTLLLVFALAVFGVSVWLSVQVSAMLYDVCARCSIEKHKFDSTSSIFSVDELFAAVDYEVLLSWLIDCSLHLTVNIALLSDMHEHTVNVATPAGALQGSVGAGRDVGAAARSDWHGAGFAHISSLLRGDDSHTDGDGNHLP